MLADHKERAHLLDDELFYGTFERLRVVRERGACLGLHLQRAHLRGVLSDHRVIALQIVVLCLHAKPPFSAEAATRCAFPVGVQCSADTQGCNERAALGNPRWPFWLSPTWTYDRLTNWGSVMVSSVSRNMRFLKSSLLCESFCFEFLKSYSTSAMYLLSSSRMCSSAAGAGPTSPAARRVCTERHAL